jgi:hypothetical protein
MSPKKLEEKLKREAVRKGLSKERTGAYVFGNPVMQKLMKQKRGK